MTILIVLGAVLVAAGLFGLGFCIWKGFAVRRARPAPETARAIFNRLLAVNLASVGLAGLGLAMLVIGLTL